MIKAVIFDFDGVLVLSEHTRFLALKKSTKKFGINLEESLQSKLTGKTTKTFLNEVLTEEQKKQIPSIIEEQEQSYKSKIEQFVEPVESTVAVLRNYHGDLKFAVASASDRRIIKKLLVHMNIDSKISEMVGKEDVAHHKPHPETYLKAIEKLNLPASACIAVEDTVVGLDAANAAGLDCYILLNGNNHKSQFVNANVKGFINSKKDMEEILRRLSG